jgi:acyl-CoA thioester hydrolase
VTAPIAGFSIVVPRRVEWGEMDAMNHVNNVVYFRWFETARAAYFAAMGCMLVEPRGIGPILKSVGCTYRAPLQYPDDVVVGVRAKDASADRFTFEHVVHSAKHDRVVAQGDGVIVAFDYDRGEKVAMPQSWWDALARIEGRPLR